MKLASKLGLAPGIDVYIISPFEGTLEEGVISSIGQVDEPIIVRTNYGFRHCEWAELVPKLAQEVI